MIALVHVSDLDFYLGQCFAPFGTGGVLGGMNRRNAPSGTAQTGVAAGEAGGIPAKTLPKSETIWSPVTSVDGGDGEKPSFGTLFPERKASAPALANVAKADDSKPEPSRPFNAVPETLVECEGCGFNCVPTWATKCPVCLAPTPEVTE